MCVKAESFDVEEEVGRWSTDGRWDGVSPPAAPGQILAQSAARHCAAAANVLLESASRVLLGNAVGALPSFQFKCEMLRANWWAGYSGTAGSLVEDPGGRLGRSWQTLGPGCSPGHGWPVHPY